MVDRDIPEEMVEKAALAMHDQSCTCDGSERCRKSAVWPRGVLIAEAREILSAALEGCAVVQLPEPDGVERDGGTYWTYPGGRVVVWPTGRFREDRVDRYRRMAMAMLAAAEFDEKQHGPASGSGGG